MATPSFFFFTKLEQFGLDIKQFAKFKMLQEISQVMISSTNLNRNIIFLFIFIEIVFKIIISIYLIFFISTFFF